MISHPISQAISQPISRSIIPASINPVAAAYFDYIRTNSGTLTGPMISSLNNLLNKWAGRLHYLWMFTHNNATLNAPEIFSLDTVSWGSTTTQNAGYISGDGTLNGSVDNNKALLDVCTVEDCLIGALVYTAPSGANMVHFGSGATAGTSIRLASQNSVSVPVHYHLGVNVIRAAIGNVGVQIGARKGGTTYHGELVSGGYSEGSTTAALTGSYADNDLRTLVSGGGTGYSDAGIGGTFVADGLDAALRQELAEDIANVWEIYSSLTLPS